ncbi:hypothetical protein BJ166DRAFT_45033 [Pestalotiopsis sp. NC0098]|nr:hypothetical protein BJ166DRAFT_45033 [Pestalotiopsis sp. NC0098]
MAPLKTPARRLPGLLSRSGSFESCRRHKCKLIFRRLCSVRFIFFLSVISGGSGLQKRTWTLVHHECRCLPWYITDIIRHHYCYCASRILHRNKRGGRRFDRWHKVTTHGFPVDRPSIYLSIIKAGQPETNRARSQKPEARAGINDRLVAPAGGSMIRNDAILRIHWGLPHPLGSSHTVSSPDYLIDSGVVRLWYHRYFQRVGQARPGTLHRRKGLLPAASLSLSQLQATMAGLSRACTQLLCTPPATSPC